ncbi:MAG: MFS transporter [Steroidobacteraceae bacterium]|nr:MFS transporter [Steroidobacteraceae bacterium]
MSDDDQQSWPSETYSWYVVLILCVCGMVAFVDRQIINLLVEDIKQDLAISDTQISLLQGLAFAVFYAVMAIPLGRLADTGNRRWIIAVGALVWTAAAMACGLARSFWQLFAARTAVGVGEATLTPAGFSLLADLFRPQRLALPLSVYTGSSFFGSGVALIAGGAVIAWLARLDVISLPLVGEVASWQAAFIIAALPGFFVAAIFFLTVAEPRRRRGIRLAATDGATRDKPTISEVWQFVVRNGRVFAAVFGGVSMIAATQFAMGAWVPAFLIRDYAWTPSQVGYTYGVVFLTCGTLGVVAGGWLADRFQERGHSDGHLRVALLAALCSLPFVIGFPLVGEIRLTVAFLALAVLFGTMAFGAGPALIPFIAPPRMRGLLVAAYLLVANLIGQAGGPWLVAVFTDYVFGAPELVRYSLAVVPPVLLTLGALLIASGRADLRRLLIEPPSRGGVTAAAAGSAS